MTRALPWPALIGTILLCSACTIIKVEGGKTAIVAGHLQVKADEETGISAISRQIYGIGADDNNLTIGYKNETIILQGNDAACAIIVFASKLSVEDRIFFENLASKQGGVCVR